jgi:hypothetical protein
MTDILYLMKPVERIIDFFRKTVYSVNIEDIAFIVFFTVIEPFIGTFIPHSNLNNPHPGVPDASLIAVTCFAAGILSWACAATRVTSNNKTVVEVDENNLLARFFVIIYGAIIFQIGTEYLEATSRISSLFGVALLALGMFYFFGIIAKYARRLPAIPHILRRIIIIPFLLYISFMMDAIFEPVGTSTLFEVIRALLLSVIMFVIIILPVRRFSECEPFTILPWVVRYILFTGGIVGNLLIITK